MVETLHVPGFREFLIVVPKLTESGHQVVFHYNTVTLILNDELRLLMDHPLMKFQRSPTYGSYSFAMMATTDQEESPPDDKIPITDQRRKISLELMHRRLGHPAFRSLLSASDNHVWNDVRLVPEPEPFCTACKVGSIRSANRGSGTVSEPTSPAQVLFCDVVSNPSTQGGLTAKSHFPYYLIFVDGFSKYSVMIGTKKIRTQDVIKCLERF